jgi:hypothetical protein
MNMSSSCVSSRFFALRVHAVDDHVEVALLAGVADVVVALDLGALRAVDRVFDRQRVEAEDVVEQGVVLVLGLVDVDPEDAPWIAQGGGEVAGSGVGRDATVAELDEGADHAAGECIGTRRRVATGACRGG